MASYQGRFASLLTLVALGSACSGSLLDVEELRHFVETTMQCRHIPGMTLAFLKGNESESLGFGRADVDEGIPVDNSTRFGIGSVSKSFTMTLLAMLLSEHNLTWTTKVLDIIGEGYGFIDEYRSGQATLKDLLAHRMGLPALDIGVLAGIPRAITRADMCRRLKYLPEQRPFRDEFLYNNYMYMLLGHVAEKLGGDTWENLVTTRIFEPLGMHSTSILREPGNVLDRGMARPYIYTDGKFKTGNNHIYNLHPMEPAGAILSCGSDMLRYMRFVLNMGRTDTGEKLVDFDLYKQAFTSVVTRPSAAYERSKFLYRPQFPVSDTPMGYGYAWFTSTYEGYRRYWHSGGLFSYITLLWIFPDKDIGVFASVSGPAVGNFSSMALAATLYHVTDQLMDNEPWVNTSNTCSLDDFWQPANVSDIPAEDSSDVDPAQYTGMYGSAFMPSVNVRPDTTSNTRLQFDMGTLKGYLHSTQDKDRFLMEVTAPWEHAVAFTNDNNDTIMFNSTFQRQDGNVQSIVIRFDVNVNFTKDFSILDPLTSGYTSVQYNAIAWNVWQCIYLMITSCYFLK